MVFGTEVMCEFILLSLSSGTLCTNTKDGCKSCLVRNPGYRYNYSSLGLHGSQIFFAEINYQNVLFCYVH